MLWKQRGISVVEFLTVLLIITILSTMSISAFHTRRTTWQAEAIAQQLQQLVHFARTSAILLGQTITLCPASPTLICGNDWSQGIIIVTQLGSNQSNVLRKVAGNPSAYQLHWHGFGDNQQLNFQPTGLALVQNGSFYYRSKQGQQQWRLVVSRTGRARLTSSLRDGDPPGI